MRERFDLLVADPVPVFRWLAEHTDAIVRKMAYHTVAGWHVKVVLDGKDACTAFRSRWSADFSATGTRVTPRPPEEVLAELPDVMLG